MKRRFQEKNQKTIATLKVKIGLHELSKKVNITSAGTFKNSSNGSRTKSSL